MLYLFSFYVYSLGMKHLHALAVFLGVTLVLASVVLALAIVGGVFPSVFGSTLKVAVIDTGLDLDDIRFKNVLCKDGHKDFTGTGLKDNHGHGTHVAGLIKKYAGTGNYCILIFKYSNGEGQINSNNSYDALEAANIAGADFINYSSGGDTDDYKEYIKIKSAIGRGAAVVVAAGNDGVDHDSKSLLDYSYFPADYRIEGMHVVGNLMLNGNINPWSNRGSFVTDWVKGTDIMSTLPDSQFGTMSGTSQAAAIQTGMLIRYRLDHQLQ